MKNFKFFIKTSFTILFFLNIVYPLKCQESDTILTIQMKELVISATKTEKPLNSLTVPAIIIDKEEVINSGQIKLNQILSEQIGITTKPTFSGGEGIQLQGIESDYILILLDGLPLIGRVAGDFDLSRVSVGSIDRIEVIKGASSSLHGSEAIGGIINIISSANNKKGFTPNLSYYYGSSNTHDLNSDLTYNFKNLKVKSFLNYYSTKGYDLIDDDNDITVKPFKNFSGDIDLTRNFNKSGKLRIKFRTFLEKRNANTFITGYGENPLSEISEKNLYVKYEKYFKNNIKTFFDIYRTNYLNKESLTSIDNLQTIFLKSHFDQTLNRLEFRVSKTQDNISFDIGTGVNHEMLDRTNVENKPSIKSSFYFFQSDWKLNEKLNIVSGIRYDDQKEYKSKLSPKLSFKYYLNEKIHINGSLGYGFKAPDFRQMYLNFTNSQSGYIVLGSNILEETINKLNNNDEIVYFDKPESTILKPENSQSYNLGIQYYLSPYLPLKINLFRNNIDNLIEANIVGRKTNGQSIFSYRNVKRSFTTGLEFSSGLMLNKNLHIDLGYQLLYAKDNDVVSEFQNDLVYARDKKTKQSFLLKTSNYFGLFNRSRHQFNIKGTVNIRKINSKLYLRAIYMSKFGLIDTNNNTYLDTYDDFIVGHVLINLTANKKLTKNLDGQVIIRNLTGYKDEENLTNNPGRRIGFKLIYKR